MDDQWWNWTHRVASIATMMEKLSRCPASIAIDDHMTSVWFFQVSHSNLWSDDLSMCLNMGLSYWQLRWLGPSMKWTIVVLGCMYLGMVKVQQLNFFFFIVPKSFPVVNVIWFGNLL